MPYQTLHSPEIADDEDEQAYLQKFERNTKAFTLVMALAAAAAAGMAALISFI